MSRDQRLLLLATRDATVGQVLLLRLEVLVARESAIRVKEFETVSLILKRSLADPDDYVTIRTRAPKRVTFKHVLFVLLLVGAVAEYSLYSLPRMSEWLRAIAHQCGLG